MTGIKRWIVIIVLFAVAAGAVAGYTAWRRDEQYRTLIASGDRAAADEDSFGAIEAFSGAIALRPSSMLAWLKRGEVYLRRGDYRSALRDLREAVQLDPAALRPLELLGDTQAALERPARAAALYQTYLDVDDRDARVLYKLAVAHVYEGKLEAAVTALQAATRLNDEMPEVHYLLGICLGQQGRRNDAIRALRRGAALAPARLDIRTALAEQYRQAGRHTEEIRELQAVAALDPQAVARSIAVADAWLRANRAEQAASTLIGAIDQFPDDTALLTALGRVWLAVAESSHDKVALGKALTALRQSTGRMPTSPGLALLGRAQLLSGDVSGAFRSLQQASAQLPIEPRTLADLAEAASRLGRKAAAREARLRYDALAFTAAGSSSGR
ncbi:MAG: tetratricopeptide repeat protein [Vicinamibacterales bacterium]